MNSKIKHVSFLPILTSFALLLTGTVNPLQVQAAESTTSGSANIIQTQDIVDEDNPFSAISQDDKVLQLPDGGFVSGTGKVEIFSINDLETPIQELDLDNDPNAMTVDEAYALWESEEDTSTEIMPYQDIVVPSPDKVMGLSYGQVYTSQKFSASGWRFAGWWFVALQPDVYGSYLRWSTHVDSGRVVTIYDFHLLANGGTAIYPGQYYWINAGVSVPVTYCTYNPISGTYYTVGNVDP